MLFTSPTPFNRFVVLRCPSIELEVANEVNEKLVKEDKHYVRIREVESDVEEVRVVYQRKCVMTEDGGVISLDWPENLEICEEHGLDTTIVIVAGSSEGSMDENVRRFVDECVKRGCFPVVVNPRGCAGSPLTTARYGFVALRFSCLLCIVECDNDVVELFPCLILLYCLCVLL